MSYHKYHPIDPRDAFEVFALPDSESTQDAAASQAALLLSARAGVLGIGDDEMAALKEEFDPVDFRLPELRPLRRSRRLRLDQATRPLGLSAKELATEPDPESYQPLLAQTVKDLYEKPSIEAAAALFEGSMSSPHPLVRVAAAAGARETTRVRARIRQILEDGAESAEPLVSRIAQTALAHIDHRSPTVQKYVIARPGSKKRNRRSHTSVVTHGTFAAGSAWYQPGGEFYEALKQRRPDLAVHDESFTWTGAYSHPARRADARLLARWIGDQGLARPDFFAHSHGGTVALLATRQGVEFNRLVLMALPVHGEWFGDFTKISRIIDVRVRFDLVIMADRGGQRFRTNEFAIEEHRHGWFDHTAPHEPQYWDDHDLWDVV